MEAIYYMTHIGVDSCMFSKFPHVTGFPSPARYSHYF